MSVRREGPGIGKVVAMLDGLDGVQGKVGWFESSRYPSGEAVAYIATIHEFGYAAGGIPARPFMRPAVAEFGQQWMDLLADGTRAVISGTLSARGVLEAVTLRAAGDVAKMITRLPPLTNPRTIARKGNAKALVDTGLMIQSVTGKVEDA